MLQLAASRPAMDDGQWTRPHAHKLHAAIRRASELEYEVVGTTKVDDPDASRFDRLREQDSLLGDAVMVVSVSASPPLSLTSMFPTHITHNLQLYRSGILGTDKQSMEDRSKLQLRF